MFRQALTPSEPGAIIVNVPGVNVYINKVHVKEHASEFAKRIHEQIPAAYPDDVALNGTCQRF